MRDCMRTVGCDSALTCSHWQIKLGELLFLFFLNSRFAHDRSPVFIPELWEAGANPALPRNCKRGQSRLFTGNRLLKRSGKRSRENPGKDAAIDRTRIESLLASQETGANHHQQPFRVQRSMVCVRLVVVSLVLLLSVAASAVDLKVKVLDPQSAAVAGAQVSLLRAGETAILASETTSAEGTATFHTQTAGSYKVQVLAPGFAAESVDVPSGISSRDQFTVNLRLATASETVVVSATRTPVPEKRRAPTWTASAALS